MKRSSDTGRAAPAARGAGRAASNPAGEGAWEPPVFATVAVRDEGIAELDGGLDRHFAFLEHGGGLRARRARQLEQRTREVFERALRRWVWSDAGRRQDLEAALADVAAGRRSPYDAAAGVVERIRGSEG